MRSLIVTVIPILCVDQVKNSLGFLPQMYYLGTTEVEENQVNFSSVKFNFHLVEPYTIERFMC
jgi:hypothetical protein